MSYAVKDKVALITGANRGIGKAIVEAFLQQGARKVYLAVRNLDATEDLVARFGNRVAPLPVDIASAESINRLAQLAPDVQIVVNNAGVLEMADPLSDHVEQALKYELEVNVFGLIRMANAFAPILEHNGGGVFVQLNSVASITNFTELSTYSASKAAAYSITQGLRDKFREKGIQVLSVHPGPISTDMADQAGMGDVAAPVSLVSEGIIKALQSGQFHLFPDPTAQQIEAAYQSYAQAVVEAAPEATALAS